MIWGYILAFVTALTISGFTHKESEMRNSQLSGYVFAALFMASLFLHSFGIGQIVTLLVLLSYFYLFTCYEAHESSVSVFVAFMFLGLAGLVFPPVRWLAAFYWIAIMMLRSFGIKPLLASLFGIVIPWLWLITLKSVGLHIPYLQDSMSFALPVGGYESMTKYKWIMSAVICLLFLYSSGLFRRIRYTAKSKTRAVYQVITLLSSVTVLFMFISPSGFMVWYQLALLNVSLVLSRMLDKVL